MHTNGGAVCGTLDSCPAAAHVTQDESPCDLRQCIDAVAHHVNTPFRIRVHHLARITAHILRSCGNEVSCPVAVAGSRLTASYIWSQQVQARFGDVKHFPAISRLVTMLSAGVPVLLSMVVATLMPNTETTEVLTIMRNYCPHIY